MRSDNQHFACDGSRLAPSRRRFLRSCLAGAVFVIGHHRVEALPHGQGRLILNTAFGPPISTPDRTGFFDRLMRSLFETMGYAVAIQSPPAERALMLADAGIDDGDGPRIPNLDNAWNYPNLIRVDEKLLDVEFNAFTLDPDISVTGWPDLMPYQVGIVTGWKILERYLNGHPGTVNVRDAERLFLLLKNRRADIVVIDKYSGIQTSRELGMAGIRTITPALVRTPMYLYLNSKHAALAFQVSDELRKMKQDGRYRAIFRETLSYVDK